MDLLEVACELSQGALLRSDVEKHSGASLIQTLSLHQYKKSQR